MLIGKFYITHPNHPYIPVLPGLFLPLLWPFPQKFIFYKSPIFVVQIVIGVCSNTQWPASHPPLPISLYVESCTSESLSQFLRILFNGFLGCHYFRVGRGKRLSQKSSPSLFINCESTIMNTTAGEAPLLFKVSRSADHGFSHGILHQHGPQTSTNPLVSAGSRDGDTSSNYLIIPDVIF